MKKIALVVKRNTEEGNDIACKTLEILDSLGCTVYLTESDKKIAEAFKGVVLKKDDELFSDAESVIVFGGDGTIMRTAHKTRLPILGVNMGRIGYIAELEPDELHLLKELVTDNYKIEHRMMLDCSVSKAGKGSSSEPPVLNDIVLSKGSSSVMPEIELVCNGEDVGKYFADGLICCTPTGSTAYSLAAGGSIIDPGMECFGISPICPQSFYAKPLIFGGDSVLEFKKGSRGHGRLFLTRDGVFVCEIEDGDTVTVKKSRSYTKLIRIKKNNFYSVMRSKVTEI
ncbi:MAG: NAD(+)/NADH kinase [Clostridia bacterium]|nr:NAD(+)/NADH kinase [Clostridia bacterium]